MIEHYNKKIQNIIQKELFKANSSIKIAVAWFTNELLFQPLLLKLQTGVSVELVLNKDDINNSEENDIDFSEFVENGGILHWNDSQRLMHEKFCIIDDETVIYGSYNWTNKAEYNDESIAVSKNEQSTVDFYLKTFEKFCEQYPSEKVVKQKIFQPDTFLHSANSIFEAKGVKVLHKKNEDNGKDIFRLYNAETNTKLTSYDYENILFHTNTEATVIAVKKENKWFFFNLEEKYLVSEIVYEEIKNISNYNSFWIKQNGLWGIEKCDGTLILSCKYSSISIKNNKYIVVKCKGKFGLYDWHNFIWECNYDLIELLSADIFKVKENGKCRITRTNGIIVYGDYDGIEHVKDNRYIVSKGGLCGIVEDGIEILPCLHDNITCVDSKTHNQYILKKKEKYGLLVERKLAVPCEFDEIKSWTTTNGGSYWTIRKNNLYGLVEGDHIKHDCKFEEITCPTMEIYRPLIAPVKFNGMYGLFDHNGDVLVDFKYKQISIIDKL